MKTGKGPEERNVLSLVNARTTPAFRAVISINTEDRR